MDDHNINNASNTVPNNEITAVVTGRSVEDTSLKRTEHQQLHEDGAAAASTNDEFPPLVEAALVPPIIDNDDDEENAVGNKRTTTATPHTSDDSPEQWQQPSSLRSKDHEVRFGVSTIREPDDFGVPHDSEGVIRFDDAAAEEKYPWFRELMKSWFSWSCRRLEGTSLGILSSSIVLIVRLMLDMEPTAYVIHSIVVFLDMLLIHLFTNSLWLSVSGELVTIFFFLAFHFTKQTLFELLETTFIACLCSFHLIASRGKHMQKNDELERNYEDLRRKSVVLLRQSISHRSLSQRSFSRRSDNMAELLAIYNADASEMDMGDVEGSLPPSSPMREQAPRETTTTTTGNDHDDNHSVSASKAYEDHLREEYELQKELEEQEDELDQKMKTWFTNYSNPICTQRIKTAGENFFEHFLDGSAGVMYTSFLGLIIDEIINYDSEKA